MESTSPMNSLHTPSPGWNPTVIIHIFISCIMIFLFRCPLLVFPLPQDGILCILSLLTLVHCSESKVDIQSPSSDGISMEVYLPSSSSFYFNTSQSNGVSSKTVKNPEDEIFTIQVNIFSYLTFQC